jgi:hypothetical protein
MRVLAMAAFFDVATESRRPADLDGSHQPQLFFGQCVSLAISPAVTSKDVSQFQDWPGHGALLFGPWFSRLHQRVQRTGRAGHDVRRYLSVSRGRVDAAVTEQGLNHTGVGPTLQ